MQLISKIKKSTNNLDLLFESKKFTAFLNPYSYYLIRKNDHVVTNLDNILIDGISLVKLFNIFNIKTKRYSFDMTSIAPKLFEYCIKNKKSIYFIGSKESEIKLSIDNFKKSFEGLNVAGYRNGYFNSTNERDEVISTMRKLNPDVVVCGMGTPNQELFLIKLHDSGFEGVSFTCGGFLHQSTETLDYYPKIANKLNLRWVYRIIREPKLFKRYFITYPIAFLFILKDLFSSK